MFYGIQRLLRANPNAAIFCGGFCLMLVPLIVVRMMLFVLDLMCQRGLLTTASQLEPVSHWMNLLYVGVMIVLWPTGSCIMLFAVGKVIRRIAVHAFAHIRGPRTP